MSFDPCSLVDRTDMLNRMIEAGMTIGEVQEIFAKRRTPEQLAFVASARDDGRIGDELEVDETAIVSMGDDDARGAFVSAWLWVELPEDRIDQPR